METRELWSLDGTPSVAATELVAVIKEDAERSAAPAWPGVTLVVCTVMLRASVVVTAVTLTARPDGGIVGGKETKNPCVPLPKAGSHCSGAHVCVIDWGKPGGSSRALWCRDGKWVIEEERNLSD